MRSKRMQPEQFWGSHLQRERNTQKPLVKLARGAQERIRREIRPDPAGLVQRMQGLVVLHVNGSKEKKN